MGGQNRDSLYTMHTANKAVIYKNLKIPLNVTQPNIEDLKDYNRSNISNSLIFKVNFKTDANDITTMATGYNKTYFIVKTHFFKDFSIELKV